jgi:hypothetical protein
MITNASNSTFARFQRFAIIHFVPLFQNQLTPFPHSAPDRTCEFCPDNNLNFYCSPNYCSTANSHSKSTPYFLINKEKTAIYFHHLTFFAPRKTFFAPTEAFRTPTEVF